MTFLDTPRINETEGPFKRSALDRSAECIVVHQPGNVEQEVISGLRGAQSIEGDDARSGRVILIDVTLAHAHFLRTALFAKARLADRLVAQHAALGGGERPRSCMDISRSTAFGIVLEARKSGFQGTRVTERIDRR